MSEFEDSPAFPIIHPDGRGVQYYGMTLRDYFAAKAMQGMLSGTGPIASDQYLLSRDAYTVADAMLKERAK